MKSGSDNKISRVVERAEGGVWLKGGVREGEWSVWGEVLGLGLGLEGGF